MKRDMDLLRSILLDSEEREEVGGWIVPAIEGYSPAQIAYHTALLDDAGFVETVNLSNKTTGTEYGIRRLTMSGHEFLEASRNPTVWAKMRDAAKAHGLTLTLQVGQKMLEAYAREKLGIGGS